ncbi:MAG: hypothetical protein HG450_000855 [Clostridiales bacterium]|nr:hypothetical protein [Clostridiales bacterium]
MDSYKKDRLLTSLTEKSSIQLNLMELKVAYLSKLQLHKINKIKNNLKNTLINQALKYKRDISEGSKISREIDSVINSYATQLNYIGNIYDFAIAKQLARISDIQSKIYLIDVNRVENKNNYIEIENEYNQEIRKIEMELSNFSFDSNKVLLDEKISEYFDYLKYSKFNQMRLKENYLMFEKKLCQEVIINCEDNIEDLIKEKELTFEKISDSKNLELENLRNNSMLKKILENILNRIGGHKRFIEEAIKPIRLEIKSISDEKSIKIRENVKNKSIDLCEKVDNELRNIPNKALSLLDDNGINEIIFNKYNDLNSSKLKSDKYNIDKAKFVFDIKNCELINRIYLVDKVKNFAEIGIVTSTIFGKSENKIVKKCACDNVIMATKKAHDSTIKKINMTTNCNKIILEERNKILERVSIQESELCAV